MKTAEDWLTDPALGLRSSEHDVVNWVKQIQLDAYKAGMTNAEQCKPACMSTNVGNDDELCFEAQGYNQAIKTYSQAILSARDKKETI